MLEIISTTDTFPKTVMVRNTVGGMIWQVYHVNHVRSAEIIAEYASKASFESVTLEDFQPNMEETFPNWRNECDDELARLEGKHNKPLSTAVVQKIYIVYYDNGMSYEDHDVSVNRVFQSKESADRYVEQSNAAIQGPFKPSMTEEQYNNQDPDDIHYSYEEFCQMEMQNWMMWCNAYYYVRETDVNP